MKRRFWLITTRGVMQIRTFTDAANGRNYCVLMEVRGTNSGLRMPPGAPQLRRHASGAIRSCTHTTMRFWRFS